MSVRTDYGRRASDRFCRPASLTRRTVDVVLFAVMVVGLVWLWTGGAQ